MADPNDIRDEFSPLLDDELSQDARDVVEAELAQDADLLRELDALRKVDALYRGLPRKSAPEDMAARVQEQLRPKLKVTRLRTWQVSRALYTGLAAAAMFGVLIGGVVIRQEFFVSPSAENRLASLESEASFTDKFDDVATAEEAPEKEVAEALGDVAAAVPLLEAEVDSVRTQPARSAERDTRRDEVAQSETGFRQESFETASADAPAGGLMELQAKGEVKAKPQTVTAAAPPPLPRALAASSEAIALGRAAGKAGEETAPMTIAADADALSGLANNRTSLAKKRANVVERIANREFDRREDGWYQRGYDGEPTQIVLRGSEAMSELAPAIPGLEDVLALKGDIVLQHEKTWYRIPAKDES